jgi:hypothetical protein
MNLTTTEAIAILTKHLGVDVKIVDVEIVDVSTCADDWIINTRTEPFPPYTLDGDELLDVVYSDGRVMSVRANAWPGAWNTNNKFHIVKYRKV